MTRFRSTLALALLLCVAASSTRAQPSQVSYQGELKKDGLPYTGVARLKFALLDGGMQSLWSNDGTSVNGSEPAASISVDATNGIFAVRLGASPMDPITGDLLKGVTEAALRVWVNTGDGFEQLTDQPISSGVFALSSEKVNEVGPLATNAVPRWNGLSLSTSALFANESGDVGIGIATPMAKLDVAGTVKSSAGGFEFPDGTVQTTAVQGGGAGVPSGGIILTTTPSAPAGYAFVGMTVDATRAATWESRSPMRVGRGDFASASLNGKIYVISGMTTNGLVNTVEEYDSDADMWSTKAPTPLARWGSAATACNGAIYVLGGNSGFGVIPDVLRYDPASDSWTVEPPMPTPRSYLVTATVNERIYAIGGGGTSSPSAVVEAYDPSTSSWETRASLPSARHGAGVAVVNGTIYVIGGYEPNSAAVASYDPASNTWQTHGNLPTPRRHLACSVVGNRIYALGGTELSSERSLACEEFDLVSRVWSSRPILPAGRFAFGAESKDGFVVMFGGFSFESGNPDYLSRVDEFRPPALLYVHQKQ